MIGLGNTYYGDWLTFTGRIADNTDELLAGSDVACSHIHRRRNRTS